MGIQVEKKEGNMALITLTVPAEEFEAAVEKAYLKNRGKMNIAGFRKGKAPRAIIEKMYGETVFFEDACNLIIPDAYGKALDEEEVKALEISSQPEIDVKQCEKGKDFIFTALCAIRPEVTLGQYKDLGIKKDEVKVEAKEIEDELKRVQEQNSRTSTVDGAVLKLGDVANIDYEGFMDGVAFDGGKDQGYDLKLGSHSFIDTFEDQLVGHKAGDEVEVNVTFPAEYHAANLAGKPAMFKVKVNSVQTVELPELNDEFADEVSDFSTLEEYKKDIEKKILEKKQSEADSLYRDQLIAKIVENSKMDIPEAMIAYQAKQLVRDYGQRLQMQGLSMEMFLKYTNQKEEDLVEQFKDQAKKRIENSLVLEAIAKAENIVVTDEDVKAEIKKMAENYKMEEEKLTELISDEEKEAIKNDIAVSKAVEFITK